MIRIDDATQVGTLIADMRAMFRLTQREFCAQIGMTQARLSEWETGKAVPSLPCLLRAAHSLGYDLALVPREGA